MHWSLWVVIAFLFKVNQFCEDLHSDRLQILSYIFKLMKYPHMKMKSINFNITQIIMQTPTNYYLTLHDNLCVAADLLKRSFTMKFTAGKIIGKSYLSWHKHKKVHLSIPLVLLFSSVSPLDFPSFSRIGSPDWSGMTFLLSALPSQESFIHVSVSSDAGIVIVSCSFSSLLFPAVESSLQVSFVSIVHCPSSLPVTTTITHNAENITEQ